MPYIGKGANGFGIRERYRYSATSNQTDFTSTDLDSKTLQIDSGSLVDVYLNGVLLDTADYNTNTANQVTLTSGATASDEVMIVVYDVFSLSDAMPKTGGALSGTITNFTSTGIDDNADATAITIDSSEDVTLSGDLSSGLNKSIDLRDNDGHVSGRLRNISSSKNALVIEADPDNSGNNSNLRFYIDGSEQAIIDHNYDFKVNNGDIFFGTAGKGIVLGATSNTDANTLDDYEEGTWSAGSAVGSINTGGGHATYTKVGRLVHVSLKGAFANYSNNESVEITGLPFTPAINQAAGVAMHRYGTANDGFGVSLVTTGGRILFYSDRVTSDFTPLKHNQIGSANEVILSVSYYI